MSDNIHCPMIHGGLHIICQNDSPNVKFKHCCLRPADESYNSYELQVGNDIWNDQRLQPLREYNNLNQWDKNCWTCQGNEESGLVSLRTGSLQNFGQRKNLSGPQRLDLMFDVSCNLACRICSPQQSTYWQKHLKDNNIPFEILTDSPVSQTDKMIDTLRSLDLSNLEMVVFCGGETLMGDNYWRVANAISELCPHASKNITLCFQTNGTQSIKQRHYEIIEKFHLVRLNFSIDGVGKRFNYQRWPADWNQVVKNLFELKESLPTNVVFLIEETISIFNLYYQDELANWLRHNFSIDQSGNAIDHTRHVAHNTYALTNLTQQYVDAMQLSPLANLIPSTFIENPDTIQTMVNEITKFDKIRNEDWRTTFPEVAEFYSRYL